MAHGKRSDCVSPSFNTIIFGFQFCERFWDQWTGSLNSLLPITSFHPCPAILQGPFLLDSVHRCWPPCFSEISTFNVLKLIAEMYLPVIHTDSKAANHEGPFKILILKILWVGKLHSQLEQNLQEGKDSCLHHLLPSFPMSKTGK